MAESNGQESKESIRQKKRVLNRLKKMNQQQIQEAIKKKKELNTKALEIVKTLLDPVEDTDKFLLLLRDINQSHYQDVVEERSIIFLCGYPLCKEKLKDIPKKQYTISLSQKKVFDITERKMFCSNDCYRASNFIKAQLFTSPLWLRDTEEIPNYKLLSIEKSDMPDMSKLSINS